MTEPTIGSLFTGYGGLDLAVEAVFGARTAWTSDIDRGANAIIARRFPGVPNLGDISTVDWAAVQPVDVLTGGFPCQDVSHAGLGAGMNAGSRSGLWSQMAIAIDQLRPRMVVAENVRGLLSAKTDSSVEPCPWCLGETRNRGHDVRALGVVLADLADLGYDAEWVGVRASDVGAPHQRLRIFVVAHPADTGQLLSRRLSAPGETAGGRPCGVAAGRDGPRAAADPGGQRHSIRRESVGRQLDVECHADRRDGQDVDGRAAEPATTWGAYTAAIERWETAIGRVAPPPTVPGPKSGQRLSPRFVEWMMGLPDGWVTDVDGLTRAHQLKALGNGVVPQQAAAALRLIAEAIA